jgi:G8 domain/Right handed beta helix region/Secretion system C-terminal sorting domain
MLITKSAFLIYGIAITTTLTSALHFTPLQNLFRSPSPKHTEVKTASMVMCSGKAPVIAAAQNWSDPATWGGTKPVAGSTVTIAAGQHIILDENTPDLAGLTINGILEFKRQNLTLTADWIMVMGTLQIGTAAMPFTQQATITLNATDTEENIMGMGTRGLMVMGGNLELHGATPNKTWTKINAHVPAGSTNLSLIESVSWQTNDQIVVAPTDYFGTGPAQKVTINSISGSSLTTSAGMNAQRWGLMQYATSTGMSLSPGTVPATVVAGTPTQLDERAEVGNLTRKIVIQAPDDALWQNNLFGCHIMIMRQGATQGVAHINGVEIRRGGQDGRVGRYPFHWHMLSYDGSSTLSDASGQYIRNSSVHQSVHRGIVIHGTNGVEVSNNVLFDIRGHGIFTEDASERRNTINGNLVLHVRNPASPLKVHESDGSSRGSSGMWVSNPDNIITNNTIADCGGTGYWFAFTTQTWGLSAGIDINPSRILFGVFDGNTAHSNNNEGVFYDFVEIDNDGNTYPFKYISTTDGQDPQWPYPNQRRHLLSRYTTWKNAGNGIWNRAAVPDNDQVVSADNCAEFFSGAGDDGLIKRSLVVGISLNYNMNGMTRPSTFGADVPVALASYHSTFDIKDNFILNFAAVPNTSSGAFSMDDYYLIPVDKGLVRNTNNTLVASHPGVRIQPWEPQFTLAGALWDPHDYWGGSPTQDNYLVYDTPFLTYNQTPTIVQPNTATSGAVLVQGPFYGVDQFVVNKANSPYYPLMQIDVKRLNNSLTQVGTWTVGEGQNGELLANMRHFSAHPTGLYDLTFPTIPSVNDFSIRVSNMLTVSDFQVLAVEFDGDYLINGLFASTAYNYMDFSYPIPSQNDTRVYTPVANLQAVLTSTTGEVYWQDRTNDKVWFKVKGGLNPGNSSLPVTADQNLYKTFNVRAFGSLAPLPVELLRFEGQATTNGNLLTWITASEENNGGFEIEASTNGIEFEKIGFVAGKITSNTQQNYAYLDTRSKGVDTYYRLRQVDMDGKSQTAQIILIEGTSASAGVKVYPNPAVQSSITIETNTPSAIRIINSLGQLIYEQAALSDTKLTLPVSDWPDGIYYIQAEREAIKLVKKSGQ